MRPERVVRRLGPLTAAGRRRARDSRLAALRSLPLVAAWRIEGNLVDFATRFPVPQLLLAGHAHPELAFVGERGGRPACVASVLVAPADAGRRGLRRAGDGIVLLTTLEVLGRPGDFVVTLGARGELLRSHGSAALSAATEDVLRAARDEDLLDVGCCVAVGDTSVSVVGDWPPETTLERTVAGRLDLLTVLADTLDEGVP